MAYHPAMKPLRAPWPVWAAVAVAPLLWFLYEQPGDPFFDDRSRAAFGVIAACLLLLWGWKLAWILSAGYSGAFAVIFLVQLFDPSGKPELRPCPHRARRCDGCAVRVPRFARDHGLGGHQGSAGASAAR